MRQRIALIVLILFIAAVSLFLSTQVATPKASPNASPGTTAPPSS